MSWYERLLNLIGFTGEKEIEYDPMKFLIVGLGNIGAEYEYTRHNVGFEVIDHLAKQAEVSFNSDSLGSLAQFKHKGKTYHLLKPSTYMNRSGKAVRYWMQKFKVPQENILIVLDDLNLNFGKQRLKGKGSDGGHNGLKDIDKTLGNNKYARLRIGIGSDYHKGQQVNFVLGKWNDEEAQQLPEIISTAAETCKSFGAIGLQYTMNKFNKK